MHMPPVFNHINILLRWLVAGYKHFKEVVFDHHVDINNCTTTLMYYALLHLEEV